MATRPNELDIAALKQDIAKQLERPEVQEALQRMVRDAARASASHQRLATIREGYPAEPYWQPRRIEVDPALPGSDRTSFQSFWMQDAQKEYEWAELRRQADYEAMQSVHSLNPTLPIHGCPCPSCAQLRTTAQVEKYTAGGVMSEAYNLRKQWESQDRLIAPVRYVPTYDRGDVVGVNKPEDDNHGREGPVWQTQVEGQPVKVWFETGIQSYDADDLTPVGRQVPMGNVPEIYPTESTAPSGLVVERTYPHPYHMYPRNMERKHH